MLPPRVLEELLTSLRRAWPEEGCGLLVGRAVPQGWWHVDSAEPTANVAPPDQRRRRFEMDPVPQIALARRLRGGPIRIIGHYHSHPGAAAIPSETDRRMATDPDLLWLLVGLQAANDPAPTVAAWAVTGWSAEHGATAFREVAVRPSAPGTR